jgi:hypothetical protein
MIRRRDIPVDETTIAENSLSEEATSDEFMDRLRGPCLHELIRVRYRFAYALTRIDRGIPLPRNS